MGIQAILFIVGFLCVLGVFIYFIRRVSARLDNKIDPRTYTLVERLIIAGIIIGIVAMFQPWIFVGYKYGFLLLLFSTLSFIVWSHVTPALTQYDG
ncbi:hypothetical protein KFU94_22500 [Chloroflexi bacterium TSY]|nr:hypothetical protein [Chloroflexi bacterium TSY]